MSISKILDGLRDTVAGRFVSYRTPNLEYRAFPMMEIPGEPWQPARSRPLEWKELPSGHLLWVRPLDRIA